ncbi:MAG: hypothetical protein FD144_4809 [Rhodospirillaceae bacterium]|nr:MAG: hypothetical protein FD144_4809 [Rhodospirillaceae bacterium]
MLSEYRNGGLLAAAPVSTVKHTPTFHGEGACGTQRKAVKPCPGRWYMQQAKG